ncbi:MAG: ParB/RepB/Spo0J family partition protein [Candidatus Dormibacteria bacterium]
MSTLGIIQPLTVRPTGNGSYVLVAGERRLAAALAAGLKEVPTIVREMDDKTALAIALVENCLRQDLTSIFAPEIAMRPRVGTLRPAELIGN